MTQFFDENGIVHPATLITAGPVVVTQVKTEEKEGYVSVQVGYGAHKESRRTKAEIGPLKWAISRISDELICA
mgnify:CR=1 FL=1